MRDGKKRRGHPSGVPNVRTTLQEKVEIAYLLIEGKTRKQVADIVKRSPPTISTVKKYYLDVVTIQTITVKKNKKKFAALVEARRARENSSGT